MTKEKAMTFKPEYDYRVNGLGRQIAGGGTRSIKYDRNRMQFLVSSYDTDARRFRDVDISTDFRAAMDIENIARFWLMFLEKGDPLRVKGIVPLGKALQPKPEDHEVHGKTFRWRDAIGMFMVPLHGHPVVKSLGALDLMSYEPTLWRAVSDLVMVFAEQAPDYPGKVPVVIISGMKKGVSGTEFVFEIEEWIDRPDALPNVLWFHANGDEDSASKGNQGSADWDESDAPVAVKNSAASGNGKSLENDLSDRIPF
jgi:hypothetical protein